MVDFSERLRQAIAYRGISQTELCKRTNIPKSAMSQYISGAFKPKQIRTHALAVALNVSEAWLMGYDVPMERETDPHAELIAAFDQLSAEGQQIVIDCAVGLVASGRYKKTTADTVGDIA